MAMSSSWFGVTLLLQGVILVTLVSFGEARPKLCLGESCNVVVKRPPSVDVLGAYCADICYGKVIAIYNHTCNCDSIVTTAPPPCTTSYLQLALCDWSTRNCNNSQFCNWRKKMSFSILVSENMQEACDCPLKEKDMKDPCVWESAEMTLCSVLKVNQMLYADFQCRCDTHPPTPPPTNIDVCEYTKHRPAQLAPARRKRLFAGNDAFNCNYPGVVGLFIDITDVITSVCTATLLSDDTVLFDQQCKTSLKHPTHVLVDSYDVRGVSHDSLTLDINSIKQVDENSAANALFTAKLTTKLVLDDKCVQPACLPNVRTPVHHIDLDDCRVLGYGDTSDVFITGPHANKLQEIKVKVDPTSISSDVLEVTRHDGYHNAACLNEFSAPLVCAHKYSKEWITIGVHQYVGVVCSGRTQPDGFQVSNLLSEAMGNHYYEHLKEFQPSPGATLPQ